MQLLIISCYALSNEVRRLIFVVLVVALSACSSPLMRTHFATDTCIKPFKDYRYLTCCDIHFYIEDTEFVIPNGFETDLASIPRIVWPIMSPAYSKFIRPAIVHDWFYRKSCDFDRKQTDIIFYHMLVNEGVSPYKANAMYLAVRLFGGKFYNEEYYE